jgi:hypothetical protein
MPQLPRSIRIGRSSLAALEFIEPRATHEDFSKNQNVEGTCALSLARLEGVKKKVGFIPDVYSVIAESPCSLAGHTAFADSIGIPEAVVSAMREKRPVPDARLDALSKIVRSLVRSQGHIRDVEIREFVDAGYTRAQFIEVILGVSLKTFCNYASVALNIPLDAAFREYAWQRTEEIGCTAE